MLTADLFINIIALVLTSICLGIALASRKH